MVADGQRDRITRLHTRPRPMPSERPSESVRKPEPLPMGSTAADYVLARQSTEHSGKRIASALSVPCPVCAAAKGVYCYVGGNGFCLDRWLKGLTLADSTLRPGDLEKIAAAQRAVNLRHEREEREAARQARGGRR
jgi:hypothetical protein